MNIYFGFLNLKNLMSLKLIPPLEGERNFLSEEVASPSATLSLLIILN